MVQILDDSLRNLEPPNTDVFYVQDNLKEILIYFKKCETIKSKFPFINEKTHEIKNQGIKFHSCLQKSISQSSKLEIHADSVLNYIQLLVNPTLDSDLILDILRNLLENTRMNMEETQEVQNKYNDVKNKLCEINNEFFTHDNEINTKLQLLPGKKEKLEELKHESIMKTLISGMVYIAGFILSLQDPRGILVMILSAVTYFCFRNKTEIQKTKDEIKVLNDLRDLRETQNEIDINRLCNNVVNLVTQMEAFNNYWVTQYHVLDNLKSNLSNARINLQEDNSQNRRNVAESIRNRWQEAKVQCDRYTRTVRNLLAETQRLENVV